MYVSLSVEARRSNVEKDQSLGTTEVIHAWCAGCGAWFTSTTACTSHAILRVCPVWLLKWRREKDMTGVIGQNLRKYRSSIIEIGVVWSCCLLSVWVSSQIFSIRKCIVRWGDPFAPRAKVPRHKHDMLHCSLYQKLPSDYLWIGKAAIRCSSCSFKVVFLVWTGTCVCFGDGVWLQVIWPMLSADNFQWGRKHACPLPNNAFRVVDETLAFSKLVFQESLLPFFAF